MPGIAVAVGTEPRGTRREIIGAFVDGLVKGSLVPTVAVFTAAANHRFREDTSAFEPGKLQPARRGSRPAIGGEGDGAGKAQATLAFIAYTLDGADPHTRPVTFATNGGPGSASGWLQLGALGPWRLPMDDAARFPSAPPILVDNAQTWLDFTDLVFIDPAGTGWSTLADDTEATRRAVWSVNGDVTVMTEAVRRWLAGANRLTSPKFFAGESYAGLRGPRLARNLADNAGIGLSGLILISPLLDAGMQTAELNPLVLAAHLPSMAAVDHHLAPAAVAEAETYATGDYLQFLLHGNQDQKALDDAIAHVATLTGLDPALVRRHDARITPALFLREHDPGRISSVYDASLSYPNPFPEPANANAPDPIFAQFSAPVTSAMTDMVANRLNWRPDRRYDLSNNRAFREWDWGRFMGRPEAMSALRLSLATDPAFRVLIGHGVNDLVTPYVMTKFLVAQLPASEMISRIRVALHDGGHMFYTRDASRVALHDEARALVTGQ